MKSPLVNTLVIDELVTAQFLVLSKEIRQKKTGEPYLSLHLADRTGEIEAKMWDNVAEVMHTFERDHFVKVKGLPQLYNNRSQFVIHKLRRLEDSEVAFQDYFPCSERHPDEMFAELESIIAAIGNPDLRSLLLLVFKDNELASLYKVAPAAKTIHHACRGGLLEHVLSLCALGKLTAAHYKEIDLDLLLTGIILHDIGKVEELSYARSFGYSSDGQLLGHIVLGLRLVGRKFDELKGFPHKLRTLIEHMIVSHHGELEFGSPKVPLFPEAMLLHHLDNLDSKMNAMSSVLRRDQLGVGEFTSWVASLERVLLRKDRYLGNVSNGAQSGEPNPSSASEPAGSDQEEIREPVKETPPEPSPIVAPATDSRPAAPVVPKQSSIPGIPVGQPAADRKPEPHRPQTNTLFGEKLQAVLGGRK